jgi:hypothetical protein
MAATDGTTTWLGCDGLESCANSGASLATGSRKWIVRGAWALGVVGDSLLNSLAEAVADRIFADATDSREGWQHRAWTVARGFRAVLMDNGWQVKVAPGANDFDINALIAAPGRVWGVTGTLALVDRWPGNFMTAGSGWEVARGAADHLFHVAGERQPEALVRAGVETAIRCYTTCGGSTWYHKLEASA